MLVQTTLVATRRTYVHRRLGLVSMAVAAGVLVTGMLVPFLATSVRWHAWQSLSSFPARADAVVVSCTGPMLFAGFVTAGFLRRGRPELHKRLMLLASIAIINAAVARALDDFGWPIVIGPFGFEAENGLFAFMPAVFEAGFGNVFILPFVLVLAVYDYRKAGRIHPATIVGALAIAFFEPVVRGVIEQLR
jgi:hypothetical protein